MNNIENEVKDMIEKRGLFEELKKENHIYPENHLENYLNPREYFQILLQEAIKGLNKKYEKMYKEDNFEELYSYTNEFIQTLGQEQNQYSLPLSSIFYRYDQYAIPLFDQQRLSKIELITNDKEHRKNFFKYLKFEMLTSDEVYFMVSFIKHSGIQLLIRTFEELEKRNVPIYILTSTYLNVTDPVALEILLSFQNVQVKVYETNNESFHTKAYLFHRFSGFNTAIIGSSNLSHTALKEGYEWNIKIPDEVHLPIYKQAKKIFFEKWQSERAVLVDKQYIVSYEEFKQHYQSKKQHTVSFQYMKIAENIPDESVITPNQMQKNALAALTKSRELGKRKGLVIAATGTGKTYLAALDAFTCKPKRLLFIVHREEILNKALETFRNVFGPEVDMGKLTGKDKDYQAPFLFSTIQTISKEETLRTFTNTSFDYIIVDEFHHAAAGTYKKVLEYFEPKWLLGLTATPERTDGNDILTYCDHNIVYEIRLRDALEHELLVPFHYFGVNDDTVSYDEIEQKNGKFVETSLVRALKTNERVDYVIRQMEKYKFDGPLMKGLGFCASIDHAKFMSHAFNEKGYVAEYLTGEDTITHREEIIKRLESNEDPLSIIFVVDIFNEGIDIPSVNLLLFLRPTESSTIFIQQLGRGLRKAKNKEFVTILDFIGNYDRSFMIPMALSGQLHINRFDKKALGTAILNEFADLPAGSYVDLDMITQKQLLDKIENIRFDSMHMLKQMYEQMKLDLGRSPELRDFLYMDNAPSLYLFLNKKKTWMNMKKTMKDLNETEQIWIASEEKYHMIKTVEGLFPIKWPYDLAIIACGLTKNQVDAKDVLSFVENWFSIDGLQDESYIYHSMKQLEEKGLGTVLKETFSFSHSFYEALKEEAFVHYLEERIEYGLIEFQRTYKPHVFFENTHKLVLYQNYTRNDIIYLFQTGNKPGSWREGVARFENHYFLFVNLHKDETVSDHLQYKDYFMDQQFFHWQSQNQTSPASSRGIDYIKHREKDIHIHLFVRKYESMNGMTLPFMYLGEVEYVNHEGSQPMSIVWKLHHSVPEGLYIDFIR